jgi:signal transduction histidine kinase
LKQLFFKFLLGAALALSFGVIAPGYSYAQTVKPFDWEIRVSPKGQNGSEIKWQNLKQNPGAGKLGREFQGNIEYRAKFSAPKHSGPVGIYLSQIGEVDRVYVNGHFVGQTGGFHPNYQNFSDVFREYLIHGEVLNLHGDNELTIETYAQYVGIKGVKTDQVEIGDHFLLQKKQYWKTLIWTLVRLGIPGLCLFLAFLFMPWFSPASDKPQMAIIPVIGISAFAYALGNSRVLFHLLPELIAYKILVIAALTGWVFAHLYGLRTSGLKSKWIWILLVGSQIVFPGAMLLAGNFATASYTAKVWIAFSLPLSILVTSYLVLKAPKDMWLIKLTMVFLTLITTNDVLHALRFINSMIVIDLGFSVVLLGFMTTQIMAYKKGFFEYAEKRAELLWSERFLNLARQVAHDIRSPLQSMVFASENLRLAVGAETEKDRGHPVNVLRLGLARINSILSKLISEFRGPEATPITVHTPKLTLIDKCISDVLIEHRYGEESPISIELEGIDNLAPTWGVADPVELQTAISNLLRNAMESFEKSTLPKSKRRIRVVIETKGDYLTLAVQDNGVGISAENFRRVFEKGFTLGKSKGTGLGLPQVKEALEKIEGKVEIASRVNVGTTVKIAVPIEPTPTFTASQIEYDSNGLLYFVDDDPSVLEAWKLKLASSAIALNRVIFKTTPRQIDPDALSPTSTIVLDHYFRDDSLNGLEWIAMSLSLNKNNIYLCTTAYDDPEVQAEVKKLGIKLIPKPLVKNVAVFTKRHKLERTL